MKVVYVFLLAVLIISCATTPMLSEYGGEDKGFLVASVVAESDTSYGTYMHSYINKMGDNGSHFFYVQNNMWGGSERDFDNDAINGIVEVHSLPPGKYELVSYRIINGGAGVTWSPKENYSYEFDIESGKITYIGEIRASGTKGKNSLGITIDTGAIFYVSDKGERDIPVAKRKAGLEKLEVIKNIPSVKILGEIQN